MVRAHDDDGRAQPVTDDSATGGDLVPLRRELAIEPAGWSVAPPARPEILSAGPDPVSLLYALRRRWLLAGSLAAAVGGTLALLVFVVVPIKHEVEALLRVARYDERILQQGPTFRDPQEFDTYRRTQTTLIKSNLVLLAALRNPAISQIPVVKSKGDNAVTWLQDELLVDYPGDAEILRLRMVGQEKEQLVKIVNAVVEAYIKEVVDNERQNQLRRRDLIETTRRDNQRRILNLNSEYIRLAEESGSPDSEAARNRLQMTHNELTEAIARQHALQRSLTDAQLKQMAAESKFKLLSEDPGASEYQVEMEFYKNPLAQSLQNQLFQLDFAMQQLEGTLANPRQSPRLQQYQQQREQLENELDSLRLELLPKIQSTLQGQSIHEARAEVELRRREVEILSTSAAEYANAIAQLRRQIQQFSRSSAELESLKAELTQLNKHTELLGAELERIRLDLEAPQRVRVVQSAAPPEGVNLWKKMLLVGFVGLMGFGTTLVGVSYWEFQSRRVDSSAQLVEGLGIRVVGTLPQIAARRGRAVLERNELSLLQGLMTESIDGIRTALIHSANGSAPRVIMVTSAMDQEGKTTVASQLAASLARSGRRTLLIDGDLRNPSIHRLFEMPLEEGLSEALRGEAELDYVIRPTRAVGLWMISAGHCNQETIQELAKDAPTNLFKRLKSEFDFLVIDSAPVLSVADTLLMGQHADAAVLSVLRGVSRVPSVYEADERLQSVGIEVLGAVVGGVASRGDRRIYGTNMQASA